MDYFQKQIELMGTYKTTHQGIKLSRGMYGYEPSEEALKSIRENSKEVSKGEKI